MGKDFESWFHQRKPDEQFPNAKSLKLPFDHGIQNVGVPYSMPCANFAPTNDALRYGFAGVSNFEGGQMEERHGLYCLPQLRQGFMPDSNHPHRLMPETDFLGRKVSNENHGAPIDPQRAPKKFLVFDRTGDKTTLILSSMISAPSRPINIWNHKKPVSHCNGGEPELGNGSSILLHSEPNLTDEFDDDNVITETHENSKDIDALLSSDDEDEDNFTEDDGEETSTGRSPSNLTAYEKRHWFGENEEMDEVASSTGPSKRQKLSDISYEVPSITHTSCSLKYKVSSQYEDDAESRCTGGPPPINDFHGMYSLPGSKTERKEKIRETVNILQSILPDGNEKDTIVILDKAINYLKTLKHKAKSLEISSL